MSHRRCVIVVLDSLGVGFSEDALKFGDEGANTLISVVAENKNLKIDNLKKMGLLSIDGIRQMVNNIHVKGEASPMGAYGKMREVSNGKDTTTGHLELMGLISKVPFNTYPDGFPKEIIEEFEKRINRKVIGNKVSSGTKIIDELGELHERSGDIIVYTSADSVFQVAANEDIIPLDELYDICSCARKMMVGKWAIGRVIARPYIACDRKRIRTSNRRDYALDPHGTTLLDILKSNGKKVYGIGKIGDIFNGIGITDEVHTKNNTQGIDETIKALNNRDDDLIFTNLVDFDSEYGHRRDPVGYGRALEEFDVRLPEIWKSMRREDVLFICADHGNDPMFAGFNHTREHVPILVCGQRIKNNINLGTLESFADLGATVAQYLGVPKPNAGESFLNKIEKRNGLLEMNL